MSNLEEVKCRRKIKRQFKFRVTRKQNENQENDTHTFSRQLPFNFKNV